MKKVSAKRELYNRNYDLLVRYVEAAHQIEKQKLSKKALKKLAEDFRFDSLLFACISKWITGGCKKDAVRECIKALRGEE